MKINEIEKDIEIPKSNSIIYPFPGMEVGDSFLIVADKDESLRDLSRKINSPLSYYKKRTKKGFISRIINKENGVRIWRVK